MRVLSLFDGISCGKVALDRCGLQVDAYYSSEIDRYAINISQANHPEIKRLGDVRGINSKDMQGIDLIIGGSPCQGFSMAGKRLNFEDHRSALFFEYLRLVNEIKPKYFILENVKMDKAIEAEISELLGVQPIMINSSLVSAQTRKRLYWTNIPNVTQPKDMGIYWGDVRERGVEWSSMYYSGKAMEWIGRHGSKKNKKLKVHSDSEKMQMIEASHYKKYSSQRFIGIIDRPAAIVGRKINQEGKRDDSLAQKPVQCLEVSNSDKIRCLSTVRKDSLISRMPVGRYPNVFNELTDGYHYRYITPLECERLQTLPDNYTSSVSNTQRYKAIGNGWTVDVIAHILSFISEVKR